MKRDFVELFHTRSHGRSTALSLCFAGKEACQPGHSFGPAIRAHYLVHFVLRGNGKFTLRGDTWQLSQNQLFVIKPGETSYYEADTEDPWEYIWIAFTGADAATVLQNCGLLRETPISGFSPDPKLIGALEDMIAQLQSKKENEYALLANLYTVFGCLSGNYRNAAQQCTNLYLRQALNFIQNNYSQHIKVQDIADYLQIDRTYLYRLFMQELRMSPKKYLLEYQNKMAAQLLTNSDLSITEIAYACGFTDPAAFSRLFLSEYHLTPSRFRHMDGLRIPSYVDETESGQT